MGISKYKWNVNASIESSRKQGWGYEDYTIFHFWYVQSLCHKTLFSKDGFAPSFILKETVSGTQKCPLSNEYSIVDLNSSSEVLLGQALFQLIIMHCRMTCWCLTPNQPNGDLLVVIIIAMILQFFFLYALKKYH